MSKDKQQKEEKAIVKAALLIKQNPVAVCELLLRHGETPSKNDYDNFIKVLALSDEIGEPFNNDFVKSFQGFKLEASKMRPTNGGKAVFNLVEEGDEEVGADTLTKGIDLAKKLLVDEKGNPTEFSKKASQSFKNIFGKKGKDTTSKTSPPPPPKKTEKKVAEEKKDEGKESKIMGMSKTTAYVVFALIFIILVILAIRFFKPSK